MTDKTMDTHREGELALLHLQLARAAESARNFKPASPVGKNYWPTSMSVSGTAVYPLPS